VLRFWHKIDMPANGRLAVYWYDSWNGFNSLADYSSDVGSWTEVTLPLSPFAGYSGQVVWWFWNGSSTSNATGIWLDDVRVENRGPALTSITPNRGQVGATLTVNGSGFGATRGASYLTFGGGVQPLAGDYVSWGNNQIQVKIPAGAVSGNVTATVSSQTSNGLNVAVILAPPNVGGLGQL
jgi:hypothetical protein